MSNGKPRRRRAAALLAMVLGTGVTGILVASPAAALHVEQYIEVAQCQPATSQDCPQQPEVTFTAGPNESQLQAQFTANANHCSDMYVRFSVDHYPQSDWLRVGPGQTVTGPRFDRSGTHVLSVAGRGIQVGCNVGHLDSWGGTVRIDSIDTVGPAPHPVPDPVGPAPHPVPAPCKWTYSGAVVIEQDNGIRVDLDQWHDLTAMGPAHLYAPGATVESNRGTIIGAGGDGTKLGFTIVWYDKKGQHVETNDYTGNIDPDGGSLGGTTTNNAGVTNQWQAHEHWTCTH